MMSMRPELVALFDRLKETAMFDRVLFDDVNATNADGENALHWAARSNDLEAARLLIEAGINIEQRGDLARTPLHEAAASGHRDVVLLLIEGGANVYALTDGDTPLALARSRRRTEVCELLEPVMMKKPAHPHSWAKMKIDLLEREIARLEKLMT
jgi:ankyrin repeat protein